MSITKIHCHLNIIIKNTIISVDTGKKKLTKLNILCDKRLTGLQTESKFFKLVKDIYKHPTANISDEEEPKLLSIRKEKKPVHSDVH